MLSQHTQDVTTTLSTRLAICDHVFSCLLWLIPIGLYLPQLESTAQVKTIAMDNTSACIGNHAEFYSTTPHVYLGRCRDIDAAIITGPRVKLVPLDASTCSTEDMARLYHMSSVESDAFGYMPIGPFTSQDAYSAEILQWTEASDRMWFMIQKADKPENTAAISPTSPTSPTSTTTVATTSKGEIIGMIGLLALRPNDRVVEIGGIWVGRAYQCKKIALEATYLLTRYLIEDVCLKTCMPRPIPMPSTANTTLTKTTGDAPTRLSYCGFTRVEWKTHHLNIPSQKCAIACGFTAEGGVPETHV
ncbi:hypothetical protein BSLG_002427 [Batrachochytrium salamandrivorans]|nr:hypothetical protein BSLG_002427 [Batrachochytrium salamandrivorans]